MSSYYGIVFPEFWTGRTGQDLREQGGKDAQLLALYLTTNRHANMLGLYRLLLNDVRHETGLGVKAIEKALGAIAAVDFAAYDAASSFVWVRQMVRFRLGIKAGEGLQPSDNKVVAVNRLYHGIDGNPFLGEFFDAYHQLLHLKKRRPGVGLVVSFGTDHNMSPLRRGFKGACKPVSGSGSDQQDQVQEKARLSPPTSLHEEARQNRGVIRAIVTDVLKASPDADFVDLKDLVKSACARHHVTYDADAVADAIEQGQALRRRHA